MTYRHKRKEVDVREEKRRMRERIWRLMEEEGVARFPLPLLERIPNFEGSDTASEKVRGLEEWKGTKTIVANPDYAQRRVREFALRDGKILIMASPRLKRGYLMVRPEGVKGREEWASTIKGAFKHGQRVDVKNMPRPDLIITGCVAVDKAGNRLGKGGGYGDREITAIKEKFGAIPVITTVHDLQIVDGVPAEQGDTKVDVIITPTRSYYVGRR